ncbi:MAG: type I DNA topoisomerase, partial [Oscillibacter sp.]|nr:type I DNA topoisomerase [Oscillibacter sp.]
MHSLVIVESPAKAKTIEKYLGKDYEVRASMGHLRDLPKSKLGVDVERDFEPVYEPIKGKEELIRELRKAAGKADTVYLATDPDREGEAISWHLKQLLDLPDAKARRVTFNEITKNVVRKAVESPREIDLDLVDAQQTRRILDRLVGYKLSPLLWQKIRRGLSAGRVQSVATRMVDDRDREIEDFQPEEYWSLDAALSQHPLPAGTPVPVNIRAAEEEANADTTPVPVNVRAAGEGNSAAATPRDPSQFTAHWHGVDGKKGELRDRDAVEGVIRETIGGAFTVSQVRRAEKRRNPAPPFTTSTLQQDASRKLNMTPRRTMAVAQQLYEGVEIQGEGAVGLITYMRTDSLRLSEEAIAAAREFVSAHYGAAYCPEQPRRYRAKGNAQDAHEAIRPSDVSRTPENVKGSLTREQYQLYRLIWSRFVACQMSAAVYDGVSVDISAGRHVFRATSSTLKFNGFTAVYEEGRDEEKEEVYSPLPSLQEG